MMGNWKLKKFNSNDVIDGDWDKMKENVLVDKSMDFAVRIIKLQKYLIKNKKETVI